MNIFYIILPYVFAIAALSVLLNAINYYYGRPKIPKRLDQMSERIAKGKVPKHIDLILKTKVSGYVEHYKAVQGRIACRAEPYYDRSNGEHVYALVIGFKEHASKVADKYITIPVYKNGQLYE